jgi:DNA/RNA endonuclease G (NUC1)
MDSNIGLNICANLYLESFKSEITQKQKKKKKKKKKFAIDPNLSLRDPVTEEMYQL